MLKGDFRLTIMVKGREILASLTNVQYTRVSNKCAQRIQHFDVPVHTACAFKHS